MERLGRSTGHSSLRKDEKEKIKGRELIQNTPRRARLSRSDAMSHYPFTDTVRSA